MRLGYIDYLNCYPFYYHMFERQPLPGVDVVPGLPSRLNDGIAAGDLDLSPISAATCADLSDELFVLPEFCLSSVGYVGSVVLMSRVPIEELDGRRVGLTSASHTSVVLLKTLLARYYRVAPEYVPSRPRPTLEGIDAALVIGNDAMVPTAEPIPYTYDLGDLWLRKTGFPVVFAVFAVRGDRIARWEKEIRAVIGSYRQSLACLAAERRTVIRHARRKYADILYDVNGYYHLLQFDFTDELKQALMFYFQTAGELGLIKTVRRLRYLSFDEGGDRLEKCA